MAGRPKLRAFEEAIETLGGIEWVAEQIAIGRTRKSIADSLDVSPSMIYRWIRANDEYKTIVREAERICADYLMDEAKEILDNASNRESNIAQARAKFRERMAERLDREKYGTPKEAAVNISIGEMYLHALRQPEVIEDAEVIEVKELEGHKPVPRLDVDNSEVEVRE